MKLNLLNFLVVFLGVVVIIAAAFLGLMVARGAPAPTQTPPVVAVATVIPPTYTPAPPTEMPTATPVPDFRPRTWTLVRVDGKKISLTYVSCRVAQFSGQALFVECGHMVDFVTPVYSGVGIEFRLEAAG